MILNRKTVGGFVTHQLSSFLEVIKLDIIIFKVFI